MTAILITVVTYVIFSVAALAFAGIDENSPTSLTNADNIDDVFTTLASETIGSRGAVIAAWWSGLSAFSATMSTVMPTARGLLSMANLQGAAGPVRVGERGELDPEVRHLGHRSDEPGDLLRARR